MEKYKTDPNDINSYISDSVVIHGLPDFASAQADIDLFIKLRLKRASTATNSKLEFNFKVHSKLGEVRFSKDYDYDMSAIYRDEQSPPGQNEAVFTVADFTEHKYYKDFYELALREIYAIPQAAPANRMQTSRLRFRFLLQGTAPGDTVLNYIQNFNSAVQQQDWVQISYPKSSDLDHEYSDSGDVLQTLNCFFSKEIEKGWKYGLPEFSSSCT